MIGVNGFWPIRSLIYDDDDGDKAAAGDEGR